MTDPNSDNYHSVLTATTQFFYNTCSWFGLQAGMIWLVDIDTGDAIAPLAPVQIGDGFYNMSRLSFIDTIPDREYITAQEVYEYQLKLDDEWIPGPSNQDVYWRAPAHDAPNPQKPDE